MEYNQVLRSHHSGGQQRGCFRRSGSVFSNNLASPPGQLPSRNWGPPRQQRVQDRGNELLCSAKCDSQRCGGGGKDVDSLGYARREQRFPSEASTGHTPFVVGETPLENMQAARGGRECDPRRLRARNSRLSGDDSKDNDEYHRNRVHGRGCFSDNPSPSCSRSLMTASGTPRSIRREDEEVASEDEHILKERSVPDKSESLLSATNKNEAACSPISQRDLKSSATGPAEGVCAAPRSPWERSGNGIPKSRLLQELSDPTTPRPPAPGSTGTAWDRNRSRPIASACQLHDLTNCVLCVEGDLSTPSHTKWPSRVNDSPLILAPSSSPTEAGSNRCASRAPGGATVEFKSQRDDGSVGEASREMKVRWQPTEHQETPDIRQPCEDHLLTDCILCKMRQSEILAKPGIEIGALPESDFAAFPSASLSRPIAVPTTKATQSIPSVERRTQEPWERHDLESSSFYRQSHHCAQGRGPLEPRPPPSTTFSYVRDHAPVESCPPIPATGLEQTPTTAVLGGPRRHGMDKQHTPCSPCGTERTTKGRGDDSLVAPNTLARAATGLVQQPRGACYPKLESVDDILERKIRDDDERAAWSACLDCGRSSPSSRCCVGQVSDGVVDEEQALLTRGTRRFHGHLSTQNGSEQVTGLARPSSRHRGRGGITTSIMCACSRGDTADELATLAMQAAAAVAL